MKRYRGSKVQKVKEVVVLPLELITQILLRLPVKSLVRFKSVCKSWLTLISDPHFTKMHFELAAAPAQRLMLISGRALAPKVLSLDMNASLNNYSAYVELKVSCAAFPSTFVRIGGSCRGFLLLDCFRHLCLWNPSTGIHKQVSYSRMATNGDILFSMFRGFGYDPLTDDYLVVQLLDRLGKPGNLAEVFSVRANKWKKVEAIDMMFMPTGSRFSQNMCGLLLNNCIHWLTYCIKLPMILSVIFAYDLTERRFLEIPLPVDFDDNKLHSRVLRELAGFLNLCATVEWNYSLEIWVMKEYKVQSSWTKTIVVSLDHLPTGLFFPICSTKNGDIIGNDGETGLTKCSKEGELKENRPHCNVSFRHPLAVYKESLLSLPCHTQQAVEDN
ncbi:unnamed protein product [Sphenostylis stenocarpa]|uniref:F-box domain-containing protein n=1 Tax=Sphenostylis stenocarpa TaxID=92480 RepID=A0AA86V8D4_9FABA|nr:unnamed protein product [Sphenostylis stenocarpa]